jgi:hypothetical protein
MGESSPKAPGALGLARWARWAMAGQSSPQTTKPAEGVAGFVAGLDGEDSPQSDGLSLPAARAVGQRAPRSTCGDAASHHRLSHPDPASQKPASGKLFLFRDVMDVTAFRGARF